MDECRTSRSDESPANIWVFWREDILDLSMIEANAQFISTNAKIKSLNAKGALLTYASFSFYLGGAIPEYKRGFYSLLFKVSK